MSSFDFDTIAAELGAGVSAEVAEAMMQDDNDRIRDRMDSRRAIMQAQVRADDIKSKLCDKIQDEKKKVPGLKEKIALFEKSDPDLYNYIRKLEIIHDGIWCPRCNIQKSIGGRKQDAEVGIQPKTEYDINALHAYESAVLERLRHEYSAFEDKIISTFESINTAQCDFDNRYKTSMKVVSGLIHNLTEIQERAKHIGGKIGQAPNLFMQPPLESMIPQRQPNPLEKIETGPVRQTYDLDTIVDDAYTYISASDLIGDN